ncbi:antiterminator Q family protein [Proteus mirabilis]|uniref:Antitermination protein Q n=1 Tax=Proteus mirabilis TaxID=584 RepID=A0A7D6AA47_PROMI|nr:antiterminator Q family protein [Proteus mirabilis]ATC78635.1 antitermination protein Q [Proteus mirabilis]EJD6334993.1 antitermination protein Q [Proteus mirabilis]EJD6353658.1 antitermination protein Q [Proteus mirabilis]EJD6362374.1 antitermination protein Q [Proteus mirabilis]EJD6580240.1 antitermination protein Q [Proteus mirabilis]
MRDIQQVLEQWGAWASDVQSGVDYSHIAAGFKGVLPYQSSSRISCCDDDGMIIDATIARLQQLRREEELNALILHYIYQCSKRSIARRWKVSESRVRQIIQIAEGFVEGGLAMLDSGLVMDHEVACNKKQVK